MTFETMNTLIYLLIPIALINFVVVIICVIDLMKADRKVKGDNKVIWLLVILLVNFFGWIIYLVYGREND